MADIVVNKQTSLPCEEVAVRAVQFFSTSNWQVTSQGARAVTFKGRVPIPVGLILLTIIGYLCCIIPGIILYIALVKKMRGFQNLVVTANPVPGGCDVAITHPKQATGLAQKFLAALPPLPA